MMLFSSSIPWTSKLVRRNVYCRVQNRCIISDVRRRYGRRPVGRFPPRNVRVWSAQDFFLLWSLQTSLARPGYSLSIRVWFHVAAFLCVRVCNWSRRHRCGSFLKMELISCGSNMGRTILQWQRIYLNSTERGQNAMSPRSSTKLLESGMSTISRLIDAELGPVVIGLLIHTWIN